MVEYFERTIEIITESVQVQFITVPPNGPLLFCSLASVVVRRRL